MYGQQHYHQLQQNYYLGTAGHRATSSYSYLPSLSNNGNFSMRDAAAQPGVNYANAAAAPSAVPQPGAAPAATGDEPEFNGGITSVLEYNINNMSTFLSWCTFGILKQNRNPSKEFDNLVVSVLFATRLPKSTIIIALEYMNQRFSNKAVASTLSESEISTILIVSLILANKFNDDNTFTNRSWCGAAGLTIEVVNYEEKEWLNEVKWQLNVVNFEDNIRTLEECWNTWLVKYTGKSNQPSVNASSPNLHESSISSYNSIPSSPISPSYLSSSPVDSSPIKYQHQQDSIWAHSSSIWSYTPTYQYMPQQTVYQPQAPVQQQVPVANQHQIPPIYHQVQQPYVDPSIHFNTGYHNAGFVGYSNPYYGYNMASC